MSKEQIQKLQVVAKEYNLDASVVEALYNKAIGMKDLAYCPYSKFRVGAAILASEKPGSQGQIIGGINVENASYPVGTCGERCALGAAVAQGLRHVSAVFVATDIAPPASPCGMCRQFMREFCPLEAPVVMIDKDGNFATMTLEQLLPMSFGSHRLLDRSRDD